MTECWICFETSTQVVLVANANLRDTRIKLDHFSARRDTAQVGKMWHLFELRRIASPLDVLYRPSGWLKRPREVQLEAEKTTASPSQLVVCEQSTRHYNDYYNYAA